MKTLFALILCCASPLAFAVNPGLGGHAMSAYIGTSSCTACATITTAASGSSFIAFVGVGGSDALTISDTYNASAKWTKLTLGSGANPAIDTLNGEYLNVYVCLNCSGGASDAINVASAGSNIRYVDFVEITNTTTVDVSADAYNGNTNNLVSVPVTPTVANDLIVAEAMYGGGTATVTSQNSWTGLDTASGAVSAASAYISGAPATSQDAQMGITGAGARDIVGITVAFKGTGGGSSCTNSGYEPSVGGGTVAVPNGTSGTFLGCTTQYVTPNCSSVTYYQPVGGKCGVN